MSGTLAVAIYAAVVATGSLIWQIGDRLLSRRTRLAVTVAKTREQPGTVPEIVVRVVNKSEHPVRIAGCFVWQEAVQRVWYVFKPPANAAHEIVSRDGWNVHEPMATFDGLVFDEPVIAVAVTQDERDFRSEPTVLVPRPPPACLRPRG